MEQKKSIFNLIISISLAIVVLVLVTVLIGLMVICLKTNKETMEISDFMGYKPIICISNSMEPEFKAGDITISKKIAQSSLNVGDIVSFRTNNEIIVHRISNIIQENGQVMYETTGDSNNSPDEDLISYNQIEGKVVFVVPVLGRVVLMLKTPIGFLLVFFIPVAIAAVIYRVIISRKNVKELRKRKLLKRLQSKIPLKNE